VANFKGGYFKIDQPSIDQLQGYQTIDPNKVFNDAIKGSIVGGSLDVPNSVADYFSNLPNQFKDYASQKAAIPTYTNENVVGAPITASSFPAGSAGQNLFNQMQISPQTRAVLSGVDTAPKKYYQFSGSPDLFDAQGNYITPAMAQADPTIYQNINKINAVRPEVKSASDFSAYAGKAVPVSAINSASPTPVFPTSGLTDNPASAFANAVSGLPTPEAQALKASQDALLAKLKEAEGLPQYQQDQEALNNIASKEANVRTLTAQLNALNDEAKAEALRVENRPLSMGAITGRQGEIERNRAVQALTISANLDAAQGDLATAQAKVDRAVNLKYAIQKSQLDTLNEALKINQDNFTLAEQRRADAITLQNNIKLKELDAKANQEKTFESYFNTALANGVPVSTVTQARNLYAQGKSDQALSLISGGIGAKSADITNGTGDIFEKAKTSIKAYVDAGYGRSDIEDEIRSQNGGTIPLPAQKALDDLLPEQSSSLWDTISNFFTGGNATQ
jgi:hypothetical protein